MRKILITGVAGFIGFHLAKALLAQGKFIVGIDNLNDYYEVSLKLNRLQQIKNKSNFKFFKLDLCNREKIAQLFKSEQVDAVINLAAQAGVRYSIHNPYVYIESNIVGFLNILEGCRASNVKHLIFASSSSVYGANSKVPFSTTDDVDCPVSLYAATKKSNELMAYTYSHLYNLPVTGLRFFTVYGPWGRPDMAPFLFTKAMLSGHPIKIFNNGNMERDFTYIDDIISGVLRVVDKIPTITNPSIRQSSRFPQPAYKIYNIGSSQPVKLMDFITTLEESLNCQAVKEFLPMQAGDVPVTYADVTDLFKDTGFKPSTSLKQGVKKFADWYTSYYGDQI